MMPRPTVTAAENMANDLYRALEVSEGTVADLQQQLEEAHATIDAVREVRLKIVAQINGISGDASRRDRSRVAAFCRALRLLDEVDGL